VCEESSGLLLAGLDKCLGLLADSARGVEGANDELAFGLEQTQRDLGYPSLLNKGKTCTLLEEGALGALEKERTRERKSRRETERDSSDKYYQRMGD
jgi:hypothetical protein